MTAHLAVKPLLKKLGEYKECTKTIAEQQLKIGSNENLLITLLFANLDKIM